MISLTLVQPRHSYAPRRVEGSITGHVYMPTSLLSVASRLIQSGCKIELFDENISPVVVESTIVGVNLIGAPYIPEVQSLRKRLREDLGEEPILLLGGQVVSGLTAEQIEALFGVNAYNGNDDGVLEYCAGFVSGALIPARRTSLIPAYEGVDDKTFQLYLSNEFSFYLSEGCKYSCTFCAAKRTQVSGPNGRKVLVRETFRSMDVVKRDLDYLMKRAAGYGLKELKLYLSNLDMFQTPLQMNAFGDVLDDVSASNGEVAISYRGLSTVASFMEVHKKKPELISRLVDLGLVRVGFGMDGSTAAVYKATRKPNKDEECLQVIELSDVEYGIVPETLMVFGHNNVDTEETLSQALAFSADMLERHGALPRPHVAKEVVPGNDGWRDPRNGRIVELLLREPFLFQALDFTALPSNVTHGQAEFRKLVAKYFVAVCDLGDGPRKALTRHVRPFEPGMTEAEREEVRKFNEGRYDI